MRISSVSGGYAGLRVAPLERPYTQRPAAPEPKPALARVTIERVTRGAASGGPIGARLDVRV
jgi:hypothetical protein